MARVVVLIVEALFTALCIVLAIVNFRHWQGCRGFDKNDAAMRRRALEHRLEAMEAEVRENSHQLHDLLERLESRFDISKMVDLRELKRECHEDASRVVKHLAEDNPPPMPAFAAGDGVNRDDGYRDDVLREGGGDDRYGGDQASGNYGDQPNEGGAGGGYDDRVLDLPPTEERAEACRNWRTQHAVSPGVSWGSLPLDLQATWRDYDCDIFVQDAVEGMLAGADAHEAQVEKLAAKREARAAAGLDDDLLEKDDYVGDISSMD